MQAYKLSGIKPGFFVKKIFEINFSSLCIQQWILQVWTLFNYRQF